MKIIDFHAHIYPPKIAEKASLSTGEFYHITPAHSGMGEELLSVGKTAGISEFVLLPVATKPQQVHHINQFILDEVNKIGFAGDKTSPRYTAFQYGRQEIV